MLVDVVTTVVAFELGGGASVFKGGTEVVVVVVVGKRVGSPVEAVVVVTVVGAVPTLVDAGGGVPSAGLVREPVPHGIGSLEPGWVLFGAGTTSPPGPAIVNRVVKRGALGAPGDVNL